VWSLTSDTVIQCSNNFFDIPNVKFPIKLIDDKSLPCGQLSNYGSDGMVHFYTLYSYIDRPVVHITMHMVAFTCFHAYMTSLVPHHPVFDRLQHAKMEGEDPVHFIT